MKKNKKTKKEHAKAATENPELTRRNFLKLGLGTLVSLAAAESGFLGFMFLKSRANETDVEGIFTAGEQADFQPGSITEFQQEGFYLLCTEDHRLMAISSRCPHLGCSVIWQPDENRFICPCHSSSFDLYGNYESRPVPRPLDIYEIKIEDSKVLVDKSRVILREKFEATQLTAPQTNSGEVPNE